MLVKSRETLYIRRINIKKYYLDKNQNDTKKRYLQLSKEVLVNRLITVELKIIIVSY